MNRAQKRKRACPGTRSNATNVLPVQAYWHYRPKASLRLDNEAIIHLARLVHPDYVVRIAGCRDIKACSLGGPAVHRRVTDALLEMFNDCDAGVRAAAAEAACSVSNLRDTRVKEAMIR